MSKKIHSAVNSMFKADQLDINGRFWSKKSVEQLVADINSQCPMICQMEVEASPAVDLCKASHTVIGARLLYSGMIEVSYQVIAGTPNGGTLQNCIDNGVIDRCSIVAQARLGTKGFVIDPKCVNIGFSLNSVSSSGLTMQDILL